MKVTDEMAAGVSVKNVDTSPERDKKGDDSLHDVRFLMTPAEVIAMRDKLATGLYEESGKPTMKQFLHAMSLADWLIESGWVVAPPKNEGENDD